jgi:hypothetical protein
MLYYGLVDSFPANYLTLGGIPPSIKIVGREKYFRISYVKGSQPALSPFLGMREKGFSIVNDKVRSKILKFEPSIFKNSLFCARFPYPAKRDKRIFEVNRNFKNFLCQATLNNWR